MLDEVQTGIGRTGSWFCFEKHGLQTRRGDTCQGSGGGLTHRATIAFGDAARVHLAAMARPSAETRCPVRPLAVLDTTRPTMDCSANGRPRRQVGWRVGRPRRGGCRSRGGLLLGVVLDDDEAAPRVELAAPTGLLVNAVAPGVIRLAPPLILTDEQARLAVAGLAEAIASTAESVPSASNVWGPRCPPGQDRGAAGLTPGYLAGFAAGTARGGGIRGHPGHGLQRLGRALGAVKVDDGDGGLIYAVPGPRAIPNGRTGRSRPGRLLGEVLVDVDSSANIAVVRNAAGAAQFRASVIDHRPLPDVIGLVAGDDTVLLVSRHPDGGAGVAAELLAMAAHRR